MRKYTLLVLAIFIGQILLSTQPADAAERRNRAKNRALSNVCKSVRTYSGNQGLIKSEISNHISKGDRRATGYTYVCGTGACGRSSCLSFYYSDGSLAGKFGRYFPNFSGNGKPRFYGGTGCAPQHFASQIARTARSKRTGQSLYLDLGGKQCIQFNPTGRNGGV